LLLSEPSKTCLPDFAPDFGSRIALSLECQLPDTAMTMHPSDSSAIGRSSHAGTHENDRDGLGQLLRRARERRGLTLEQISNETKIPRRHLEALERDNLAVVPCGFYRRAEVRAYARAVNLDQNLALAQLERVALEPPVPVKAVPQAPRTQERMLSPRRLAIVLGVVVVAAVLGRATGGREQDLDGDADHHRAAGSLPRSRPPVLDAPRDAVIGLSQRAPLDQAAPPSAPSRSALAAATEPAGARSSAASKGEVATTPGEVEARATPGPVTGLVVATQPAGARVTVDGIGWGNAPVTIRYLPAGTKRIRVSKEGYATEERVVSLTEGHLRTLDIRLRSTP
jgi:transcriptional regulator with XRE-family HTH domain